VRRADLAHPVARTLAGLGGLVLVLQGLTGLGDGQGRGAAAAVVLGVVAAFWAVAGRVPSWFHR
jgi:ABC-type Mn2+/Zn2+ transport system permease subunit